MNAVTEDIGAEMLGPVFQSLPEDAAARIVDLEAGERWRRGIEELARKATEGSLSPDAEKQHASLVERR